MISIKTKYSFQRQCVDNPLCTVKVLFVLLTVKGIPFLNTIMVQVKNTTIK